MTKLVWSNPIDAVDQERLQAAKIKAVNQMYDQGGLNLDSNLKLNSAALPTGCNLKMVYLLQNPRIICVKFEFILGLLKCQN